MTAAAIEFGGRRNTRPVAEPNVIPFIDIMLVLLIIFMVTAPTPTVDLRADAHRSDGKVVPGRRPTVVSIVDNAGQIAYAVDEQPTTLAALNDKVIERARANNQALSANDIFAQAQIFIRADQDLAYSAVIDAMAQLKNGGFAKVGIYAEEAEST